jgi:hypothetical protein
MERWHLSDPWIYSPACWIARDKVAPESEWWRQLTVSDRKYDPTVFEFKWTGMLSLVQEEGWTKAIAIFDAAITKEKKKFLKRIENLASAQGWKRAPEKHNLNYFRWLAGHQVFGWSANAIAKAVNPCAEEGYHGTIIHTIRKLAKEISLTCSPKSYDRNWTSARIEAHLKALPKLDRAA